MTKRVVNFSAGPGVLPLTVLERARDELVSLPDVGASPLEVSHRGAWFTDVIEEAEAGAARAQIGCARLHPLSTDEPGLIGEDQNSRTGGADGAYLRPPKRS